MTFNSQIYELRESEGHKVWTRVIDFLPMYFFDNYKITESGSGLLVSEGYQDNNVKLNVLKTKKHSNESIHYLGLDKESKVYSSGVIPIKTKPITMTVLVKNFSRTYPNGESITGNDYANILSFKSRTGHLNFGLCYDKNFVLYLYDGIQTTKINNITFSKLHTYQLGFKVFKNQLSVLLDNQTFGPYTLSKDTYNVEFSFAVGHDQDYARYQNGSFEFAELSLFDFLMTPEEHIWLKSYPRSWNFQQYYSPIVDLTFEQKQELKNNLEKFLHQDDNLKGLSSDVTQKITSMQEDFRKKLSTEADNLLLEIKEKAKKIDQLNEELKAKAKSIEELKNSLTEADSNLKNKLDITTFETKVRELEKLANLIQATKQETLEELLTKLKQLEEKSLLDIKNQTSGLETKLDSKIPFQMINHTWTSNRNLDYYFDPSGYAVLTLYGEAGNRIEPNKITSIHLPVNNENHKPYFMLNNKKQEIWTNANFDPNKYIPLTSISSDISDVSEHKIASMSALNQLNAKLEDTVSGKLFANIQASVSQIEKQIQEVKENKVDNSKIIQEVTDSSTEVPSAKAIKKMFADSSDSWKVSESNNNKGIKFESNGIYLNGNNQINFESTNSTLIFNSQTLGNSKITNLEFRDGTEDGYATIHTGELKVEGDINASGNIGAFSDIRLKKDLKQIQDALDKLKQINGYTFTMNNKPSTGVVAQEVQKVLPEVICETDTKEKYLTVDYGKMNGLIIEAIKELSSKIENIEQRIGV